MEGKRGSEEIGRIREMVEFKTFEEISIASIITYSPY